MRLLTLILFLFPFFTSGQIAFELQIERYGIPDLPILNAFAFGQYDSKWLIIGGQILEPYEGNYDRQANYNFIVVDPVSKSIWLRPFHGSYPYMMDASQLISCYTSYHQEGNYLYLVGGYGYSPEEEDFITYPYLMEIDLAGMVEGIVEGKEIKWFVRQAEHDQFAIKDGYLSKVEATFFLFEGREKVRELTIGDLRDTSEFKAFTFQLNEEGHQLAIFKVQEYTYPELVEAGIGVIKPELEPNLESGLSVFYYAPEQNFNDLKWMNLFDVGYSNFESENVLSEPFQSAVVPIYDASSQTIHNLYIGGCSEILCTEPVDIQIDSSGIAMGKAGKLELATTQITPDIWLDIGSLFILDPKTPHYDNGVIKLVELPESSLIGYLIGGARVYPEVDSDLMLTYPLSDQLFKVSLTKLDKPEDEIGIRYPSSQHRNFSITIPGKGKWEQEK